MKKYVPKSFWHNYWSIKKIIKPVSKRHFFKSLFDHHLNNQEFKSLVEIGGFPGHYAVYFRKYFGLEPTIIDYYIDQTVLNQLLKINNLNIADIAVIKTDFLKYQPTQKFDVVTSFGFLEHFDDIQTIIQKHIDLAKSGGKIIIAIPNFKGLNGWVQKIFDPQNLTAHNLSSMDIPRLESIMAAQNLKEYRIFYYGGLLIWLENLSQKNLLMRGIFMATNVIGHALKSIGFNSRFTSPYIVITATK